MKPTSWLYFVLLMVCLLAGGCSNTPSPSVSAGLNPTADAANLEPKVIFSDLQELDYSSKADAYQIGIGDTLEVQVFKAPEFSRQETVNLDGILTLPIIGDIYADGLTISQLEQAIAAKLREKYLQNPEVTVVFRTRVPQYITLVGEFRGPGTYPLINNRPTNIIQAMATGGGGLSDLADTGKVVLLRKTGDTVKAYHLNIDAIQSGQNPPPYVKGNDLIIAHRSNARYWMREIAERMSNLGTILSTYTTYKTLIK